MANIVDVGTATEAIIRSMAKQMDTEELCRQYEETADDGVKSVVREIITDRGECAECSSRLFLNEKEQVFYCPVCSYEFQA